MILNRYKQTDRKIWTGRIDDANDIDSFRMHQIIQSLDLRSEQPLNLDEEKLNVCFIGFCCDEGIKRNLGRPGAKRGPEYIRKGFANLPVSFGRDAIIYDAGDISCDDENMEEAQAQLAIAIDIILSKNLFPIVMGGGHEVAFGHYNGIDDYLKKSSADKPSLAIINFDAHFDLRPCDKESSSGTMFSQIADKCQKENREFYYMCLGVQTSGNTISLFKKADSLGVEYIAEKDFTETNFPIISKQIQEYISRHEHIYLTICSDVFDGASAPGVSAAQPFGMNPEYVLRFLKEILASGKVISFDIAEISPRFDHDKRTAKLAAITIYSVINSLLLKM